MTDEDTLTVSDVGIGDPDVEAELQDHLDTIASDYQDWLQEGEVQTDILAGAAHIKLVLSPPDPPTDLLDYIVRNRLAIIAAGIGDDDELEMRITTLDIYETIADAR